jgi:hypothetical protein
MRAIKAQKPSSKHRNQTRENHETPEDPEPRRRAALALMAAVGVGSASASAVVCATPADGGTIANASCTVPGSAQLVNGAFFDASLKSRHRHRTHVDVRQRQMHLIDN